MENTVALNSLEKEETIKLSIILKAVANYSRIMILFLLYKNGEMTVTDIWHKLKLEQSIVSHHMTGMRNLGIVKVKRVGKNIYYSLSNPKVFAALLNCKDIHFAGFSSRA
jgi:DNA-binding transcriptional ArsR family regulator